jgi:hypothetical protein
MGIYGVKAMIVKIPKHWQSNIYNETTEDT